MPIFLRKSTSDSKKSSGIFSFIVQFVFVAVIFFAVGFAVGNRRVDVSRKNFIPTITVENKLPPREQKVDFSLFWQVFDQLPKTFIDKSAIDSQKLLYGAISGMVRSLGDPYTVFLDPKQNEAVKSELAGSYEGVGIQIGFNREKRLAVIAPLTGSPAAKVGVSAKDLIIKIGERETFDLSLPEAVDLIRGPAGTRVKLTLRHVDEEDNYEVEITRAKITVKSVEVEFVDDRDGGRVGVIKVSRFGDTTDREWDEAVNRVQLERARAVVVDMRNNPGGLLASAVHLASDFVDGIVVKQEFSDGSIAPLASDHRGELLDIPMVVIINGGSASAAEIFAGAIQDDKRGKIVGEQSFGKGTVQDAVDLPGGSGLHITIARWLTPKGASIADVGISPDVEVEMTRDDTEAGRDPQLDRALELL